MNSQRTSLWTWSWVACLCWLPGQVAAQPGRLQMIGGWQMEVDQPTAWQEGTRAGTARFNRDSEVDRTFETVRGMLAAGKTGQALPVLQELLDHTWPDDSFTLDQETYRHPWFAVLTLLRELPAADLAGLERLVGAEAERELQAAIAEGDRRVLERISLRYRYTQAGRRALLTLVLLAFDEGDLHGTSAWCARFIEEEPDPFVAVRHTPLVLACWMVAESRQDNHQRVLQMWERYGFLLQDARLQIAGKAVPFTDWMEQAGLTARLSREGTAEPKSLLALLPGPEAMWTHDVAAGEFPSTIIWNRSAEQVLRELSGYGIPGIQRSQTTVSQGKALFTTAEALRCVDLATGELCWQRPLRMSAFRRELPEETQTQAVVRRNLGGGLYDRIVCDETTAYVVVETDMLIGRDQRFLRMRNTLVAHDLETGEVRWQRSDLRTASDTRSRVVGQYFLGAPAVEGQRLYCLTQDGFNQDDAAIHLVVLDSRTGDYLSSTEVSVTPMPFRDDPSRHEFDARIVLCGEVVLCATGCGCLAAVDPQTGVVRWAYTYPRMIAVRQRTPWGYTLAPEVIGWEWWRGWRGVTLATVGEYVVLATPESDRLMVFEAGSGRKVWDVFREFGLFIADVLDDRILVAGRRELSARELKTGRRLWTVSLPEVSGIGYTAQGLHVLPIAGGGCVAVDLDDGRITHISPQKVSPFQSERSPATTGSPPASLVRHREVILRQTPLGIARIRSLQELAEQHPLDPDSAGRDVLASVRLLEELGRLDEADQLLADLATGEHASAILAREQRAQLLLARLMQHTELSNDQVEFLKHSSLRREFLALSIREEIARRRAADGEDSSLDEAAAFVRLEDLLTLLTDSPEQFLIESEHRGRVRLDRYLQGALLDLLDVVEPAVRDRLLARVAEFFEQKLASAESDRERWKWILRFDQFPLAWKWIVYPWDQTTLSLREQLHREELLWELARSEESSFAMEAILRLAESSTARVAGVPSLLHERLQAFADESLSDGRTVGEWLMSPDSGRYWHEAASGRDAAPWDHPAPEVLQTRRPAGSLSQRRLVVEPTAPGPLTRLNLSLLPEDQTPQFLRISGADKTFWLAPIEIQRRIPGTLGVTRCWSVGPIIIVQSGSELYAFRLFDAEGQPVAELVWSVDQLTDASITSGVGESPVAFRLRRPGVRTASEETEIRDQFGFLTQQFGPFLPRFFCLPERGDLVVRETADGRELWRMPVVPGTRWLADADRVILYNEATWEFEVLRALDGRLLARHQLPEPPIDVLLGAGTSLLLEFRRGHLEAESGTQLALWDAPTGHIAWRRSLPAGQFPCVIDSQILGIMHQETGQLELLSLATGEIIAAHRPAVDRPVETVHCIVNDERIIVVTRDKDHPDPDRYYGRQDQITVHGLVHAFDRRTGEHHWTREVLGQQMRLAQPRDVPLLIFHREEFFSPDLFGLRSSGMLSSQKSPLLILDQQTGNTLVDLPLEVNRPLTMFIEPDVRQQRIIIRTNAGTSLTIDYSR